MNRNSIGFCLFPKPNYRVRIYQFCRLVVSQVESHLSTTMAANFYF